MTYTIVAIVVLVVIMLFVLLSRKPEQKGPAAGDKKPGTIEAKPKSIKPVPGAEPKAAEAAKKQAPSAGAISPAEAAAPSARSAPPTPTRDLAELRKGRAKARGETGFLGRLANLFAGKKDLDPTIADQVEEILLTGGSASTPGMSEAMERMTQKPVRLWNPIEKIPTELDPESEAELKAYGFQSAIALGLAARVNG